ncbi:MAG TPA: PAS domain S-box protein [Sediminibacterium sp.]|nr:PAS domain S-box protein [Sediminibacterium sp.]
MGELTNKQVSESRANSTDQQLFETLFKRMARGVVCLDGEGKIITANPAAEKILGLATDQIQSFTNNKPGWQFIHQDGTPILSEERSSILTLLTGKAIHNVVMGVYNPEKKSPTWILVNTEPEFKENESKPYRVFTTITDITDQINAEKELRFQTGIQHLLTKISKTYINLSIEQLDECINTSIAELGEFIGADRFYIFDYNQQEKTFSNTHEWCAGGISQQINQLQNRPINEVQEWADLISAGETLHIPDVAELPAGSRMRVFLEQQEIKSTVAVPLMDDGVCTGLIGLDAVKNKHIFSEPELMLLTVFAEMLVNVKRRSRTLELLQKSETKYREITENMSDMVWTTDMNLQPSFCSSSIVKIFGYNAEEFEKIPLSKLYPPETILKFNQLQQEIKQKINAKTITNNDSWTVEGEAFKKNGERIWMSTTVHPHHNEDDVMTGFIAITRDITAQRKTEEQVWKLSRAVEQSPVSIVITNLDGNIEYANPHTFRTTGYTPEELLGKNPRVLKSGETSSEAYTELWSNITIGKQWRGIFHNVKKNGELYWEQSTISPVYNDRGEITHFLAIKEDITERKRIEQEIKDLNQNLEEKILIRTAELEKSNTALEKARMEAEQANLAKSDFLSRMSHELRTPMNSILGFAQLLEMGALNTDQQKAVNHILRSGKHLLDLINEVLDITRIEAGRISISVEPVEVNGILREISDALIPAATANGISIQIAPTTMEPLYVSADCQRLKQILLNLVNNAIKYNRPGGWVLLKMEILPENKRSIIPVRISVNDGGLGISEENLRKIFTPFERIGAEKTSIEGTGLGLAVVKQLTTLMGGTLGVESEIGKGSHFWIELPRTIKELHRNQQNGDLQSGQQKEIEKKGSILYIEDNLSNIELVEQIIATNRPGIRLITSMFGKQAVELAQQHAPLLILLDLNLPDMNGATVLEQLKENTATSSIPVVIISADAMPNQLNALLKAGARKYLTKPFDISDFIKILDSYIK